MKTNKIQARSTRSLIEKDLPLSIRNKMSARKLKTTCSKGNRRDTEMASKGSSNDLVTNDFDSNARNTRKPVVVTEEVKGNGDVHLVFERGDLVYVEGHAWPGWNCEGGIGHVAKSYLDKETGSRAYNIKYVIGGTVNGVAADFVEAYSFG